MAAPKSGAAVLVTAPARNKPGKPKPPAPPKKILVVALPPALHKAHGARLPLAWSKKELVRTVHQKLEASLGAPMDGYSLFHGERQLPIGATMASTGVRSGDVLPLRSTVSGAAVSIPVVLPSPAPGQSARSLTLELLPEETVAEVRAKAEVALELPLGRLTLSLGSTTLEDGSKLVGDLGLHRNAKLTAKLRSGSQHTPAGEASAGAADGGGGGGGRGVASASHLWHVGVTVPPSLQPPLSSRLEIALPPAVTAETLYEKVAAIVGVDIDQFRLSAAGGALRPHDRLPGGGRAEPPFAADLALELTGPPPSGLVLVEVALPPDLQGDVPSF